MCIRDRGRSLKEFTREFERRAADSGLEEEHAKLILVGALNKNTLGRLDTYISMAFPPADGRKETMEDRLARISYLSILAFLK